MRKGTEKSIWPLGIGAWLLRVFAISVLVAAMLTAGFLIVQSRGQDGIVTNRRGEERDVPARMLEQRVTKLQATTHFSDHAGGASGAPICETWIVKRNQKGSGGSKFSSPLDLRKSSPHNGQSPD